jgi:putative transposase
VKWDPDDIGQIWVQDPGSKEWVVSACRWQHYAAGLSSNQHRVIRKFARQELKNCHAVEYLEEARLKLHAHWMEASAWKTRADRKLAAVTSGYSSARVLGSDEVPDAATPPAKPASAVQAPMPICEEEFETVVLKRGGQWHSM